MRVTAASAGGLSSICPPPRALTKTMGPARPSLSFGGQFLSTMAPSAPASTLALTPSVPPGTSAARRRDILKTDLWMKIRWPRLSLGEPTSLPSAEAMIESTDGGFGNTMKHRVVEEFVVSYLNGSLKPNLAEKNPMNGRDVEFLMDGPQLDRTKKTEVWSYANAVGTGYQYRVVYKDRRFSDLDRLVQLYTGTISSADEDRPVVEQKLYELVMLMLKEARLPKTFKILPNNESENQKLAAMVEELGRSLEELGRRVRKLEDQLAIREEIKDRDEQQTLA